jgi:hypothetical protein
MPSAPGLSPESPPLSKNRDDSELQPLLCLASTFLQASQHSTELGDAHFSKEGVGLVFEQKRLSRYAHR